MVIFRLYINQSTYNHDPMWVWTFSGPTHYANLAEVVVDIQEQNLLQ